ncbi:hypothetical protein K9M48_01715 [Candidatus Gracilibacteria bacterium]|nr:hypothetical protein [Candidatus Gracilibacteria bacterium]
MLFNFLFALNEEGTISLEITGFGIRHGTPGNLDLGSVEVSGSIQELSGQFQDFFWIEDLLGRMTGHYTTVQCNGLYGPSNSLITGIYLKAGNIVPQLILGLSGNVSVQNSLSDYVSIYKPIVYIYKTTQASNIGLANKYGDIPWIKVVIPPYSSAGNYNGTIVFSLYSN